MNILDSDTFIIALLYLKLSKVIWASSHCVKFTIKLVAVQETSERSSEAHHILTNHRASIKWAQLLWSSIADGKTVTMQIIWSIEKVNSMKTSLITRPTWSTTLINFKFKMQSSTRHCDIQLISAAIFVDENVEMSNWRHTGCWWLNKTLIWCFNFTLYSDHILYFHRPTKAILIADIVKFPHKLHSDESSSWWTLFMQWIEGWWTWLRIQNIAEQQADSLQSKRK